MARDDGNDVTVIQNRRFDFGEEIIKIRILKVPKSEKFPDGVKSVLHYGKKGADDPYIRYDNHHGPHERHEGEYVEEIEFPGYEALLQRFRREIPVDIER
ncbi:toxin-antitoxin system TumE family protein [Halorussus halophilus]|uniref:toxin-antitoxin system TumE family protein n=1 Tax=Halorussus halophilus TaxID=2650975 RepID=UPI00130108C0|nr:DUF6516 family protein [Halorussus halophilus]